MHEHWKHGANVVEDLKVALNRLLNYVLGQLPSFTILAIDIFLSV